MPCASAKKCSAAFALVVEIPELLHTEEDVEIVFERRHAVHGDAERLLDRAGAAAAGDQVVGLDGVRFAAGEIGHGRDDAAVLLHEQFKARAQLQRHGREAGRKIAQDRIEPELVAALRPLRADRGARGAAVAGPVEARDLVAGEAGEIEHGVREVRRRAGLLHALGDAPAAEQLHGARVLGGGARMSRSLPSPCSTTVHATPRQPRSAASPSPTGPPPTISTGVCVTLFDAAAINYSHATYRTTHTARREVWREE